MALSIPLGTFAGLPPQLLQTGCFYSAVRFRLIEGSPEPAEWLEVFETDDPVPPA